MAPEVVRGEPATERSDLWGLGVLLYRALHGRLPFEGATDVETFFAILTQRPARPEAPVDGLPAGLADLVTRCLTKKADRRPASCAEALLVLEGRAGPAPLDDGDRPLGREAELAELDGWMSSVAEGVSSFVLLRGAESVGVSTVLAAAGERARERGLAWIPVTVGAEGFLRPALRAATQAVLARREARSPEVEAALLRVDPKSTAESDAPTELVRDLEILLRGAAGARPFVLAIDETHRADADDLRRIEAVVRAITRDRGNAIVAVRRPGEGPVPLAGLASDPRARVVEVAPLAAPVVVEMLERDAGGRLAFDVGTLVTERSGGDLRRARALLSHLLGVGAVAERGGVFVGMSGWREHATLPSEAERVRALMDGLPATSRELVEAAAVDVGDVEPALLARVLGRAERDVIAELGRLANPVSGLFVASGAAFVFARPEVRDVVVAALPETRRHALHRAFAANLDARAEAERPDRVGLHLEGAGEPDRARGLLIRAAVAAGLRIELLRAIDLARRAGISPAGVRPPVTDDVVACALRVANILFALRRSDEGSAILRVLDEWALSIGDDDIRYRARVRRAGADSVVRPLTAVELDDLRLAAASVRDRSDAAQARTILGRQAGDEQRFEEAERELLEAIRLARSAGARSREANAWSALGTVHASMGRDLDASSDYAMVIALAESIGGRVNAAIGRLQLALHRFDSERASLDHGAFVQHLDETRHAGAEFAAAIARREFARVLRTSGDIRGSLKQSERAAADHVRLGLNSSIPLVRIEWAVTLLATGDVDAAEREARAGRALGAAIEISDEDRRRAAAVEALLALACGHPSRAAAALDRALPGPGAAPGSADVDVVLLAEALLVADPDDAREFLARLDDRRNRIPPTSRLVPRALVACVRQVLGVHAEPGDDELVQAAFASEFIRSNHLVARIASLWAEATRIGRAGDAQTSVTLLAQARECASAAGHRALFEALRTYGDRS